ncbi:hypothetical protein MASR2M15_27200 [Anaerolineales bacterium]
MLQHEGAYTIDADGLTHQAMMPGAPAYKPIISQFGQFIVGPDGRINRQMLGQIVFNNPQALKALEDIVHPVVRNAIDVLAKRAKQRVVVIEAIKLLESDWVKDVNAVWVVDAKPETQYKRLIVKRKMTPEEAKQRILSQGSQKVKLERAHVVIHNNANVEETWKQVKTQWGEIRKQLTLKGTPTPELDERPEEAKVSISAEGISARRGMPKHAETIAAFMKGITGSNFSRVDILEKFGEKSYTIAEDASGHILATLGWRVENLVTSMDEFYMKPGAPIQQIAEVLISQIEDASSELQSEVAYLFLDPQLDQAVVQAFVATGYMITQIQEIQIPAWQEAVLETVQGDTFTILWKQLRDDRVLQPI